MPAIKHFAFMLTALCLTLSLSLVAFAQEKAAANRPSQNIPITVSATGTLVRFAAVGAVERMRLEVFDSSGNPVFDTGFRPGNLRDWRLRGTRGELLPDATYLCVVTIRELSGRMSFKQGSVLLQAGRAALALEGSVETVQVEPQRVEAERIESEQALATHSAAEPPAMTVVAHDGEVGQVVSTTGPLSFRTGDLFSGKDREQMRLTEDGKLGLGTKDPQATLDVAGTIRTSKGIAFADGTIQTTGSSGRLDEEGNITPTVAGTGTQGQLTKWTDNAGTLGDSIVTESAGGNIGVGTATPNSKLHVVGALELGAASVGGINPTLFNPNNVGNFSQSIFYPASGMNVNSSFSIIPRGTGQANNRAQLVILNTDRIASPASFEFASFRSRGHDFLIATGKVGSGLDRPLMLAAGFLTNNTTNNNQLFLATNGNVGMGTNNPAAKLDVLGAINTSTQYSIEGERVLSIPGQDNTFVGERAGTVNTGQNNTFVGKATGEENSSGQHNVFVGAFSGSENTTGQGNTFVGKGSGDSNTTGSANSVFGFNAGASITTRSDNSFFGAEAGQNNRGSSNSFFGARAGQADTTAGANAFFGTEAGTVNTASLNAFFGSVAGTDNTTGDSNSFFGAQAGQRNTTGRLNAYFGRNTGANTETGSRITIVGALAGSTFNLGDKNTLVGAEAEASTGLTNATAIGADSQVTASNSLVLGSINGTNGATASTNVGIGTTAPLSKLEVKSGNIYVSTNGTGVILKSSDGTKCARLRLSNAGALETQAVTCPQ